jgi:DNA-binding NarL/FixJ family response regulator
MEMPREVGAGLRIRVQANRRAVGEAIAAAIRDVAGMSVTTDSTDPTQPHRASRRPDVVIVIGSTFDGSTNAAVRIARRRWPGSIVIALTDTNRVEDGVALVRQGADTWLASSDGLDVLRSVLVRIAAGERVLLKPTALAEITSTLSHPVAALALSRGRLTSRENQVLECFARGLSRPDIAALLGITSATLRTHVQNILTKLELHSIDRAVALLAPDRPVATPDA